MRKIVDDINIIMKSTGLGIRWTGKTSKWSKEWDDVDRAAGVQKDMRTMDLVT